MNLTTTVGQAASLQADYSVIIFQARWLRPALGESCRLLRINQVKELVAICVSNAPDQCSKVVLQIRAMCRHKRNFVVKCDGDSLV